MYILPRRKGFLSVFPVPRLLRMPAIGIDLSERSVKYAHLESEGSKIVPKKLNKIQFPDGVVEKGKVVDHAQLVAILQKIRTETGARFAYVSLPEEHGYLFQAGIEKGMSHSAIQSFIEFNLKENVPLAPEQAIFDYSFIPNEKKIRKMTPFTEAAVEGEGVVRESGKENTVSVAVYPRDVIEMYMAAFGDAGITPLAFELESESAARAVVPARDDGTFIIVDIGRTGAGLAIVSRGVVVFTATLAVGGDDFNEALQKYCEYSYDEAENVKNTKGFLQGEGNKQVASAFYSIISVLRDEIQKHQAFWDKELEHHAKIDSIERVILCGGNANLRGLPEYLEATVGVPVERADVWQNVLSVDDHVPGIDRQHSLEYATAIGLALRYAFK